MTIPFLQPLQSTVTREVGPPDKRVQAVFQNCDLFLPNKRHPLEFDFRVTDRNLDHEQIHLLTGDDLFRANQYGNVSLNQYGANWMPVREYYDQLTALIKAKS